MTTSRRVTGVEEDSEHASLWDLSLRPDLRPFRRAWRRMIRDYARVFYLYLRRRHCTHDEAHDLIVRFYLEGLGGQFVRAFRPWHRWLPQTFRICLDRLRLRHRRALRTS